jgi:hypothetical protein
VHAAAAQQLVFTAEVAWAIAIGAGVVVLVIVLAVVRAVGNARRLRELLEIERLNVTTPVFDGGQQESQLFLDRGSTSPTATSPAAGARMRPAGVRFTGVGGRGAGGGGRVNGRIGVGPRPPSALSTYSNASDASDEFAEDFPEFADPSNGTGSSPGHGGDNRLSAYGFDETEI